MRLRHYKWWQFAALLSALFACEVASAYKLVHWLGWGFEGLLALLMGIAFLLLLLGSIIAHSLDVDPSMRRWIHWAATALFISQGLANVLLAYAYELTGAMPVEMVTSFFSFGSFQLSADAALRLNAAWQGLLLSCISLSFWSVTAQMLRKEWAAELETKQALSQLDELLKQGAHG